MTDEEKQSRQYENAARFIDGEPVELDQQEKEIVDDFRADEAEIKPKLTVKISPAVAKNAQRKMHLLVRNLPKRVLRALIIGFIVAAAFALIVIAYKHFRAGTHEKSRNVAPASVVLGLSDEIDDPLDTEIDMLQGCIDRLGNCSGPSSLSRDQQQQIMKFLRNDLPSHYERLMQIRQKYPGRFMEELRMLWPRYRRMMDMSPELKKLSVSKEENRVTIYELAGSWKEQNSANEKDRLYRELEKAVGKQIDLECRIRQLRLDHLERQIGVLKKELDRLHGMRESIILQEIKKRTGSDRAKE